METLLQIEINEVAEIYLLKKENRISINDLHYHLKYKDPISYNNLSRFKVRTEFSKLFPIHKNNRKNTKCFKISKKQTTLNREKSPFRLMPFSQINFKSYGFIDQSLQEVR